MLKSFISYKFGSEEAETIEQKMRGILRSLNVDTVDGKTIKATVD